MYLSWFSYNLYAQMRPWSKRKDDVYQKLSSAITSTIPALALKTPLLKVLFWLHGNTCRIMRMQSSKVFLRAIEAEQTK
jgi:hypothetical protein